MSSPGDEGPGSFATPRLSASASGAALSPEASAVLLQYVREALGRFGTSGDVFLFGNTVRLRSPTNQSETQLGSWASGWDHLDESTRRARALEIARQLAQPRALAQATRSRRTQPWGRLSGVALATCAALGGYYFIVHRGPASAAVETPGPPTLAQLSAEQERFERAQRVCETTRTRVLRGATIGITETDGWVVEILGIAEGTTEPLDKHQALERFIAPSRSAEGSAFVWAEEPALAAVPTSEDRVIVHSETISGSAGGFIPALRITFYGALVDAYFDPDARVRYFHIAHAMSEALGFTSTALFARCEAGRTHHVGSWFRGRDDASASQALLYALGTYAEPPHLSSPFLRPVGGSEIDRSIALQNIKRAAARLDRPLLASVLGRQGGMVMGKAGSGVTITFPFRDGNRAARASRQLARVLGLNGSDE